MRSFWFTVASIAKLAFVPRTQRSTQWCAAEPGPIVAPGSWFCGAASHAAPRPGQENGSTPLGRDLVIRHILVDTNIAGQTQHPLGDDVAQDLVGAAGNAHR